MDWITATFFSILAAGFFVGIVVGLTGMGGGALMTPALIFLGVGDASTVVTADLTAAAIYKSGGAITHAKEGSPNLSLAKWLILGSVPFALAGPWLLRAIVGDEPDSIDTVLNPTHQYSRQGLDNPDAIYFNAYLTEGASYVVSGRRGTTADLSFQIMS